MTEPHPLHDNEIRPYCRRCKRSFHWAQIRLVSASRTCFALCVPCHDRLYNRGVLSWESRRVA